MSAKEAKNIATPSGQDLERVREILFGQTARDYDKRFSNLTRDVQRLQQALDRANKQISEMESASSQKLQALREEMRAADDEIRNELRETGQQMVDEKVDRQILGDLLVELGNQLKTGAAFGNVLEELLQGE